MHMTQVLAIAINQPKEKTDAFQTIIMERYKRKVDLSQSNDSYLNPG